MIAKTGHFSFSESFYRNQQAHPIVCSADCATLPRKLSWKSRCRLKNYGWSGMQAVDCFHLPLDEGPDLWQNRQQESQSPKGKLREAVVRGRYLESYWFTFQFLKFTCCVTFNRASSCCFPWINGGEWFFHLGKNTLNSAHTKKCWIHLGNWRWPVVPRKGIVEVGLHFAFMLTLVALYNRVLKTFLVFVSQILTPFIPLTPPALFLILLA